MDKHKLLEMLIGQWAGTGQGEYPTIEPFEYLETLNFDGDGRPSFLHYETKSQRRRAGQAEFVPSHWESGFIRILPTGEVELLNTQSSGRLERLVGSLEQTETGLLLQLHSSGFLNDPRMVETSRTIVVEGNTMHYSQSMHTNAIAEQAHHVKARLERKGFESP